MYDGLCIYLTTAKRWVVSSKTLFFTGLLLILSPSLHAQIDSSFLQKYPYLIGNVAFSVDSLTTPVGNLSQDSDTVVTVGMFNAGNRTINLVAGKSNRFVEITYDAAILPPHGATRAHIHINVPGELPEGAERFEAAFETSDVKNPFKFLYFSGNIVKGKKETATAFIDSVPRLIFNTYLYDFGFLRKGKTLYYNFRFTNRGNKPLVLTSITADKGLEITSLPQLTVPPGNSGTISVKIKARRYVGVLHKSITIRSNDPVNPLIILGVHGTVKVIPSKQNPTDYCIGD